MEQRRLRVVLREALFSVGIWILIAGLLLISASVWQAGGFAVFYKSANIPAFLGGLIGQFLLLALLLSAYGAWRLRGGETRKFWADVRFWVICLILIAWFAGNKSSAPILGWFIVCAIYQIRDDRRRFNDSWQRA
ncbi:MAG TPA: hypothetical protein VJN69_08205 [Candidatus Acidoferrales bacterium]|nr:hypothetical protein [Candidatus Acidoferrales bacterium]